MGLAPYKYRTMNNFFSKLSLPPNDRLLKLDLSKDGDYRDVFRMYGPDILTTEAYEFFKDNNLTVKFIVNLIMPLSRCPGTEFTQVIHSDYRTINNKQTPLICAINFEVVEPTDTQWWWFDMDALPARYEPCRDDFQGIEEEILLRAEVYNDFGIPKEAVLLDKLSYNHNDAYLLRTNIPHMVTFNSYGKPRSSVSIRFEETWETWEECLEIFKPIMKKE